MAPFGSDRRHRLNPEEVDPVKEAVEVYLEQLLETRDPEQMPTAEMAFRVLYRLRTHQPGRPHYPEPVTWDLIDSYLNNGTINAESGRLEGSPLLEENHGDVIR
jgi:hypothetical protein